MSSENVSQGIRNNDIQDSSSNVAISMSQKVTVEEKNEKTEINKKANLCNICGKSFSKKSCLKTHYQIHAGVRPFICEVCYKTFSKKCALTVHSIIHTGERPYVCYVCEKTFARKTDLGKHHLIHTGEKPYVCDNCGKGFNHPGNLRKHKIIHTGVKPHVCDVCYRAFAHKNVLLNHLKSHYMEETKSNSDVVDKERYTIRNYLKTIIKKYFHPCNMCDKSFLRNDSLQKHKQTHKNNELPHVCEVCNDRFKHKGQLQKHLLNHVVLTCNTDNANDNFGNDFDDAIDFEMNSPPDDSASLDNYLDYEDDLDDIPDLPFPDEVDPLDIQVEELPDYEMETTDFNSPKIKSKSKVSHMCTICYKVFSRRTSLKDHYLTHSGKKPHQCTICKKSFAQKVALKRHLLVHTGEKPYSCEICYKNFSRKTALRKHYIIHSNKKLF